MAKIAAAVTTGSLLFGGCASNEAPSPSPTAPIETISSSPFPPAQSPKDLGYDLAKKRRVTDEVRTSLGEAGIQLAELSPELWPDTAGGSVLVKADRTDNTCLAEYGVQMDDEGVRVVPLMHGSVSNFREENAYNGLLGHAEGVEPSETILASDIPLVLSPEQVKKLRSYVVDTTATLCAAK